MTIRAVVTAVATFSVAAAALVGAGPVAQAAAADGCRTVHAGPVVEGGERSVGYFDLSLTPKETHRSEVLLANPASTTCRVRLRPGVGHTAVNSGNSYLPIADGGECTGSSCWLSGLPRTVSVPAGGRLEVPFQVRVPEGTSPGQYLAGVIAEPADAAPVPSVGASGGQGAVSARIVAVVALGIAVTVPGRLMPAMTVAEVRVDPAGPQGIPTLMLTERNTGNTFERPLAQVVVEAGAARQFSASSATVLPGNSAVLSIPVQGVPAGSHRTRVTLTYGGGKRTTFDGTVEFPAMPSSSVDRDGNVTLTRTQVPSWVWWALGGLAILVLGLVAGLVLMLRRRGGRDDGQGDGQAPRRLPFLPRPRAHDEAGKQPDPAARHSKQ